MAARTGLHLIGMGRNTYEEMAGFRSTSDDACAAPMNDIPKVVFPGALERADWPDSTIARGDPTGHSGRQLRRRNLIV